jgi:hypothetical protein
MRIRIEHGFVTCTVHMTCPNSVLDTCLAHAPISAHVSCIGKVSGSRFFMQIGVVRCFGVQLMVIFPY